MMEIDREIHKLLGNCVHGDYYGPSDSPYSQCGKCHTWITSEKNTEIPKYSTDIAASFKVLEWLNVNGWRVTMHSTPFSNPNPCRHFVGIRKPIMSVDKYRADAETLPLAICLCALKLQEKP